MATNGTLNKVILIGNLGDEVKLHYFDNGGCIGRFSIATSESYTNKEGKKVTDTEWHTIVTRNRVAETCEKYLKKGDKVYIEGRIRSRQWQDDSGNTRYANEIIAQDFTFLTPKGTIDDKSHINPRSESNNSTTASDTLTKIDPFKPKSED